MHVDLGPARQWGERFAVRATAFASETPSAREALAESRTMKAGGAAGAATIGGLVATFVGSAWARAALRYSVTALAILLFLLSLRRSGERAGSLAERLETAEKAHDAQRQILEQQLAALAIATDWLSGRATVGSNPPIGIVCPPVVQYRREAQSPIAFERRARDVSQALSAKPGQVQRALYGSRRTAEPAGGRSLRAERPAHRRLSGLFIAA